MPERQCRTGNGSEPTTRASGVPVETIASSSGLGCETKGEAFTALLRYDPPMLESPDVESVIDSTSPSLETTPTSDAYLTLGACGPRD